MPVSASIAAQGSNQASAQMSTDSDFFGSLQTLPSRPVQPPVSTAALANGIASQGAEKKTPTGGSFDFSFGSGLQTLPMPSPANHRVLTAPARSTAHGDAVQGTIHSTVSFFLVPIFCLVVHFSCLLVHPSCLLAHFPCLLVHFPCRLVHFPCHLVHLPHLLVPLPVFWFIFPVFFTLFFVLLLDLRAHGINLLTHFLTHSPTHSTSRCFLRRGLPLVLSRQLFLLPPSHPLRP